MSKTTEREQLLEMVSLLDDAGLAELRSHLFAKHVGRPKLREKSETITTKVSLDIYNVLLMLAYHTGKSLSQLLRDIIERGIPEMADKDLEELIEEAKKHNWQMLRGRI